MRSTAPPSPSGERPNSSLPAILANYVSDLLARHVRNPLAFADGQACQHFACELLRHAAEFDGVQHRFALDRGPRPQFVIPEPVASLVSSMFRLGTA